jgi:ribosomal protein S18 acetylase RimI-like enzyme
MDRIAIRPAEAGDVELLDAALRALSGDLGDTHRATAACLARAGFGETPAFRAQIALSGDAAVGVALYSPLYSTTRAMPGAYVSDLWVEEEMRGSGLGRKLLAAVRNDAALQWGAGFIRLAVYADNPRAVAFYERIGFRTRTGEIGMLLEGEALERIGETA